MSDDFSIRMNGDDGLAPPAHYSHLDLTKGTKDNCDSACYGLYIDDFSWVGRFSKLDG